MRFWQCQEVVVGVASKKCSNYSGGNSSLWLLLAMKWMGSHTIRLFRSVIRHEKDCSGLKVPSSQSEPWLVQPLVGFCFLMVGFAWIKRITSGIGYIYQKLCRIAMLRFCNLLTCSSMSLGRGMQGFCRWISKHWWLKVWMVGGNIIYAVHVIFFSWVLISWYILNLIPLQG